MHQLKQSSSCNTCTADVTDLCVSSGMQHTAYIVAELVKAHALVLSKQGGIWAIIGDAPG